MISLVQTVYNHQKENDNYKPVLDGRDIDRYMVKWSGNYLKYDVNSIHSCKREDIFLEEAKIFFRRVGDRIIATLDKNKHYALNTLIVVTLKPDSTIGYEYLLGLLNSKLLNYYYVKYLKSSKKVFSEIQARQIEQLPIILPSNRDQKALQDKIVKLVKEMLKLNKTPELRQRHAADIAVIDKEIDELVYRLYGLSEAEKKVVEGA